jgi:hypothetical protein
MIGNIDIPALGFVIEGVTQPEDERGGNCAVIAVIAKIDPSRPGKPAQFHLYVPVEDLRLMIGDFRPGDRLKLARD